MTSPTARERAAREGPSGAGRREAATDGGLPALVPVPASADPAALALELWRQVCRTDPFEETVARLLEVVSRALPVRAVVLARVEEGKLVRVDVAHRPAGGGAMAPAAG